MATLSRLGARLAPCGQVAHGHIQPVFLFVTLDGRMRLEL